MPSPSSESKATASSGREILNFFIKMPSKEPAFQLFFVDVPRWKVVGVSPFAHIPLVDVAVVDVLVVDYAGGGLKLDQLVAVNPVGTTH